jgi:hypothetical protein
MGFHRVLYLMIDERNPQDFYISEGVNFRKEAFL